MLGHAIDCDVSAGGKRRTEVAGLAASNTFMQ